MHIVDVQQTIRFVIPPNEAPPAESTYDVQVQKPDGTLYTDSALTAYVAPTATAQGSATYVFTPDIAGRWVMIMSTGAGAANTVDSGVEIYVVPALPSLGGGVTALNRQIVDGRSGLSFPAPPTTIDYPVYDSTALALEDIYGIGYDGVDTIVVAGRNFTTNYRGLWKTDPEFSYLEEITKQTDLPNWISASGGAYVAYAAYAPPLGLWIVGCHSGQTWWTEDLVTFTEIPLGTGWSATSSDVVQIWWDPGLELFYMSTNDNRPLLVSSTGKAWVAQTTLQDYGGVHNTKLYAPKRFNLNDTILHIQTKWEEYIYKTGDSGGSTGWSITANNGVFGGSGGTWNIPHCASNGEIVAMTAFGYINMSSDPTNWPDSWGPDGNNNIGFSDTSWGWPDTSGSIRMMIHASQHARPWIFFNHTHGWRDAAELIPSIAPSTAVCTAEPWATLQTAFLAGVSPRPNINNSAQSLYYSENDADSVWGLNGWAVIMEINDADYIVMQRPSTTV